MLSMLVSLGKKTHLDNLLTSVFFFCRREQTPEHINPQPNSSVRCKKKHKPLLNRLVLQIAQKRKRKERENLRTVIVVGIWGIVSCIKLNFLVGHLLVSHFVSLEFQQLVFEPPNACHFFKLNILK